MLPRTCKLCAVTHFCCCCLVLAAGCWLLMLLMLLLLLVLLLMLDGVVGVVGMAGERWPLSKCRMLRRASGAPPARDTGVRARPSPKLTVLVGLAP